MEFVTTMVNNGQPSTLPATTQLSEAQRVIQGPCHDLAEVRRVLKEKGTKCINVITKDCQHEIASYFMDAMDLQELLEELTSKEYHNSLWCRGSTKGPWFAADAYRIYKTERDHVKKISVRYKYYLKFAIAPNGNILLFFSVHRDLK